MSKLIFVLSVVALLVGCSKPQPAAEAYDYDPAVLPPAAAYEPTPEPILEPAPMVTPSAEPAPVFVVETPATRSYTVRQGDTYYGIAARELGDGKRWQEIADLNPGIPANRLPIGATLTLPN